jgi:lipopolysaccharide export system permease protein
MVSHFLNLIILMIPSLLFILLPFATTIAVIYTYNYLSEKRQIIILQNSGLTNIQLASPGLFVALIVTLLSYYISITLLPLSYSKLKTNLNFMKNNYASKIMDEKIFNEISKDITVYFDKRLANGNMQGLVLFDNQDINNQVVLFAKSGAFRIHNNNYIFKLQDGIRQVSDHNGNLTNLSFDSLIIESVSKNPTHNSYNRDINEYYIHELLTPNKELSKQRRIKLIAEGHQRLIWPLYNFILVFLTLSIFLKQPYNKKSSLRQICITTFSVIIITYLHFTLQNFAAKNLNFVFACYANIIMSVMLSLYFYYRKVI